MAEKNLQVLLQTMAPVLSPESYVFCLSTGTLREAAALDPMGTFREAEGLSLILSQGQADAHGLDYDGVFRLITLTVHSSLEAVGLTAAVSTALAKAGISANVIAAYHHDHIFVPANRAEEALKVLASY